MKLKPLIHESRRYGSSYSLFSIKPTVLHQNKGVVTIMELPGHLMAYHVLLYLEGLDLGHLNLTAKGFCRPLQPSLASSPSAIDAAAESIVARRYGPEAKFRRDMCWSWTQYLYYLESFSLPLWPLATIYRPEVELQLHPRSKIGGLPDLAQPLYEQ